MERQVTVKVCDRCKKDSGGETSGWMRIDGVPVILFPGESIRQFEEKLEIAERDGNAQEVYALTAARASTREKRGSIDLCPACAQSFARWFESPEQPKTARQRAQARYREKLREARRAIT